MLGRLILIVKHSLTGMLKKNIKREVLSSLWKIIYTLRRGEENARKN
jgi:hypothetical protein